MRLISPAELIALESMIDSCGLSEVLSALANICDEKADHIRASYSDCPLARLWEDAATAVATLSAKQVTRRIS